MIERYVETQSVKLRVETKDSTLSAHTNLRIYYIPPKSDGSHGDITNVQYVSGTAVSGKSGNSVNQGAPITLIAGTYSFWSESNDASGGHCVTGAAELIVEKRGTIRR